MKSIVLITCWYGPYPWYFPYYIKSCKYNPTVDFIIITDNKARIENKPSNVKIVYRTLEEVKRIAKNKLGFEVHIDYSYKLCDFKPTYGLLFSEIVEAYDFWGFADIDVVYGDIRKFMTKKVLNKFDVISTRHDYITGTFCLFRNTDAITLLFKQSKDYKKVLSNPEHYCFDECSFLWEELVSGKSIFDFPDRPQSMTWVVKKAESEGKLKAFFDFIIIEGAAGHIKWDKGKIIYKDTYEAMFYHLIKFKTACKKETVLKPIPEVFYFTPTRVLTEEY